MKARHAIFVALIWLVAGCRGSRYAEKIDESSDDFQIETAVYGYLLQRHFWDDHDYSAIFLKGSDVEVAAVRRAFPDHAPPIKPSYRVDIHPNRIPLDQDTGRPAMILSVDATEPKDDRAEALGSWYAGGLVSGHYTFSLKKANGRWIIENVR